MIEVRIRHHAAANGVPLCTWPATELDTLIPMLNAWGVTHIWTGDEAGRAAGNDLSGRIQVDDTVAYFEVMIGSSDE